MQNEKCIEISTQIKKKSIYLLQIKNKYDFLTYLFYFFF